MKSSDNPLTKDYDIAFKELLRIETAIKQFQDNEEKGKLLEKYENLIFSYQEVLTLCQKTRSLPIFSNESIQDKELASKIQELFQTLKAREKQLTDLINELPVKFLQLCKEIYQKPLQSSFEKVAPAPMQIRIIQQKFKEMLEFLKHLTSLGNQEAIELAKVIENNLEQQKKEAEKFYNQGLNLAKKEYTPSELKISKESQIKLYHAIRIRFQSAVENFAIAQELGHPKAAACLARAKEAYKSWIKIPNEIFEEADQLFQNPLQPGEEKLPPVQMYQQMVARHQLAIKTFHQARLHGHTDAENRIKEVVYNLEGLREKIFSYRKNLLTKLTGMKIKNKIAALQEIITLSELCNQITPNYIKSTEIGSLKAEMEAIQTKLTTLSQQFSNSVGLSRTGSFGRYNRITHNVVQVDYPAQQLPATTLLSPPKA